MEYRKLNIPEQDEPSEEDEIYLDSQRIGAIQNRPFSGIFFLKR
jgi:hypothetical protein